MSSYNFDQVKKVGPWEVSIDTTAMYGYFEHDEEGEGGGLWFEDDIDQLDLIDYDGRACLPKNVAQAIRELGHSVGPEFD